MATVRTETRHMMLTADGILQINLSANCAAAIQLTAPPSELEEVVCTATADPSFRCVCPRIKVVPCVPMAAPCSTPHSPNLDRELWPVSQATALGAPTGTLISTALGACPGRRSTHPFVLRFT